MQEIEIKILEVDVSSITQKLESWVAKKFFEGEVDASYYDFSMNEAKPWSGGDVLRYYQKNKKKNG